MGVPWTTPAAPFIVEVLREFPTNVVALKVVEFVGYSYSQAAIASSA